MISLIGGIDTRVFVFANLSLVNWQTFIISHRLFPAEVLNQLYDPQTRLSIYSQSHWEFAPDEGAVMEDLSDEIDPLVVIYFYKLSLYLYVIRESVLVQTLYVIWEFVLVQSCCCILYGDVLVQLFNLSHSDLCTNISVIC